MSQEKKTPARKPQQVEQATAQPPEAPEKPSDEMVKVTMLKAWASPERMLRPGDTVEVSESVASRLERAGAGRRA